MAILAVFQQEMSIELFFLVKGEPFGHESAQPMEQWVGSVLSQNIMVIFCQEAISFRETAQIS